jgi:hypothetical protein
LSASARFDRGHRRGTVPSRHWTLRRGDDIDEDGELAESLHRVLSTLIKVREARTPLPAERLRERLELVRWLRGELAAVEHLLAGEYDKVRRAGAAVPVAGGAPTVG